METTGLRVALEYHVAVQQPDALEEEHLVAVLD